MPVTPLFYELTTNRMVDEGGSPISSLDGKRGDILRYELALRRNNKDVELPSVNTVRMGIKTPSGLTGDPLAFASGVKTGRANNARWSFTLSLNTVEMAAAIDGVAPNLLALVFEIEISLTTGDRSSSRTIPYNIEGDVIRGDLPAGSSVPDYLTADETNTAIATALSAYPAPGAIAPLTQVDQTDGKTYQLIFVNGVPSSIEI